MARRPTRNFFGRRRGKTLRQGRQAVLEAHLPRLQIEPNKFSARTFDPKSIFDKSVEEVWLEIGFGEISTEHRLYWLRSLY